jgi:glycosyltransferase involved in cell wall biosynthesis
MRLLIITPQYPSENDLYKNGFVHSRVKSYLNKGLSIEVYVYNNSLKCNENYIYENVNVYKVNAEGLKNKVRLGDFDAILIHFAWKKMSNIIIQNNIFEKQIIIWVHGVEALNWKRRLFNLHFDLYSLASFGKYIVFNIRQMRFYKKLIRQYKKNNIHFVFVSEWMKHITEKDTRNKGVILEEDYSIIPNPINTSIFSFKQKAKSDRLKIFSLRPYTSKKYANDITVKVINKLSQKPYFSELEFFLYGKGRLFNKITKSVKKFPNVHVTEGFFNQKEIKELHDQNGILLIPTRQDAQGVSMCEGISSGLVAVTSNNTAIPEYVSNEYGYLCNDINSYVEAIDEMYKNPEIFIIKSSNTNKLRDRISEDKTLKSEIDLIRKLTYLKN